MSSPFWPRKSPNFAVIRAAVRPYLGAKRLAIGLSGGPDSLALAAAIAAENPAQAPLCVCVDHNLQPGSRQVAERAAAQATQWGLEARVISVDAGSSESQARAARYKAMAKVGLPVMVAHTAEDQAETLLLSALRGQATGMSAYSEVEGAQIIRPLLGVRRAHTVGACAELELTPWQDPHNSSADFRRVRIRREVLPLLSEIIGSDGRAGDCVPPLAQAATDLSADQELLLTPASNDCAALAGLPAPRRRRALRSWLLEQDINPNRSSLGAIENLVVNWHGQGPVAVKSTTSPAARLEVARQGGKLALLPGK